MSTTSAIRALLRRTCLSSMLALAVLLPACVSGSGSGWPPPPPQDLNATGTLETLQGAECIKRWSDGRATIHGIPGNKRLDLLHQGSSLTGTLEIELHPRDLVGGTATYAVTGTVGEWEHPLGYTFGYFPFLDLRVTRVATTNPALFPEILHDNSQRGFPSVLREAYEGGSYVDFRVENQPTACHRNYPEGAVLYVAFSGRPE